MRRKTGKVIPENLAEHLLYWLCAKRGYTFLHDIDNAFIESCQGLQKPVWDWQNHAERFLGLLLKTERRLTDAPATNPIS